MKLSKLVGDRFKERPANCQIDSHALMVRGGYIKNVANGILNAASIKIKWNLFTVSADEENFTENRSNYQRRNG